MDIALEESVSLLYSVFSSKNVRKTTERLTVMASLPLRDGGGHGKLLGCSRLLSANHQLNLESISLFSLGNRSKRTLFFHNVCKVKGPSINCIYVRVVAALHLFTV